MSTATPKKSSVRAGRGLLGLSALHAFEASNANKPLGRRGRGGVASFPLGWLMSELSLHFAAAQAALTLRLVLKGALRTPSGWLGLGIQTGATGLLWQQWKRAQPAGEEVAEALNAELADELPPVAIARDKTKRILLGPIVRHTANRSKSNIAYGPYGRRNQLDIWTPPTSSGPAPVLVQVHGGAWTIGHKEQQALPLMDHMTNLGWVCVSINYRLSPRGTWPDHIVDVKRALAWVKANIADYGGDPDFVAITGGSAGGHLCSLAALSPNEPQFQPGFEEADTSVVAAVPFYGVFDFLNRDGTGMYGLDKFLSKTVMKSDPIEDHSNWDAASTMAWVRPDAPPFMVIHGSNDTLVPVAQARSFVEMMRAESKETVVYVELEGAQHAFDVFDSTRSLATIEGVGRFLQAIRARRSG